MKLATQEKAEQSRDLRLPAFDRFVDQVFLDFQRELEVKIRERVRDKIRETVALCIRDEMEAYRAELLGIPPEASARPINEQELALIAWGTEGGQNADWPTSKRRTRNPLAL